MLTLDNITYHKNQQVIFKELGFSIGLGSCLLLVGKNGCGKTTLLKNIAGLCQPSVGEILWNGENVRDFYQDFASDVNYIGHKNFLKPQLTAWQNLSFFAGISGTEILLPSAIRYFGLEEILETPVNQLSNGWQKKLLLSKLLYQPSTIWLLDEPTVNLDQSSRELVFNLISTRVKDGGMVIVSTHDEILFPLGSKVFLEDFK
ncbi:MAG: ccmA [Rickettsiaceae bacterium]|jgi:heme exporter protein A|nr:ccmA [Rickettsiaceae bacterium]